MLNGRLLADGGMMDPVPIAATAAAHADLTSPSPCPATHGSPGSPMGQRTGASSSNGPRPSPLRSGPTGSGAAPPISSTGTWSVRC